MWERALQHDRTRNVDMIAREINWSPIAQLELEPACPAPGRSLPLSSPRVAQLNLACSVITRAGELYYLLQRAGAVERAARDIDIFEAKSVPPQTTRAKLRGEFIRGPRRSGAISTVNWVHLKLNDQAQRTVLCKDPFRSVDERVGKLVGWHVIELGHRTRCSDRGSLNGSVSCPWFSGGPPAACGVAGESLRRWIEGAQTRSVHSQVKWSLDFLMVPVPKAIRLTEPHLRHT